MITLAETVCKIAGRKGSFQYCLSKAARDDLQPAATHFIHFGRKVWRLSLAFCFTFTGKSALYLSLSAFNNNRKWRFFLPTPKTEKVKTLINTFGLPRAAERTKLLHRQLPVQGPNLLWPFFFSSVRLPRTPFIRLCEWCFELGKF